MDFGFKIGNRIIASLFLYGTSCYCSVLQGNIDPLLEALMINYMYK